MKKVFNGKLYNTKTAKKCGEYEPNPNQSDFSWYCETLYQKKTGEFFLHCDGNAASPYSKRCGQNEWCGAEIIKTMTYTEAQKWAENHLDGGVYIEIFGDPEENAEKTALNLSIRKDTVEKLKRAAAKAGVTVSEYIEGLI